LESPRIFRFSRPATADANAENLKAKLQVSFVLNYANLVKSLQAFFQLGAVKRGEITNFGCFIALFAKP
jgi:hypothetical protein